MAEIPTQVVSFEAEFQVDADGRHQVIATMRFTFDDREQARELAAALGEWLAGGQPGVAPSDQSP